MTITFPKHKGDQEGKDGMPRHVFANPSSPEICPILPLGVMILSAGVRQDGASNFKLLFGNGQGESRFTKWLVPVCKASENELLEHSVAFKDIGSHSFRKGVATFLSGMVSGPSPIAIYLRAGWSLGVQKRYIVSGGGGDQLAGRSATGIDVNSVRFLTLTRS